MKLTYRFFSVLLAVFLAGGCSVESDVNTDAGHDAGDTDGGQNPDQDVNPDQDTCPQGMLECGGVCVDPNTNPFH